MAKVAGRRAYVYMQRTEVRKEEALLRQETRDLRSAAEQIALLMARPGLSLKENARLGK